MQRVNRTLRRLAEAKPNDARPPADRDAGAEDIRAIIAARKLRVERFGPELGDVGWALLLEAYAARLDRRRLALTSLGSAEGIARSTAHRWARALLDRGLLTSHATDGDQRVTLVSLSDEGARRLRAYLRDAVALSAWPI